MKKLINIIAGLIAGVAPFVIAVIIGVLIYNELQNLAGIIICVILGLLAVWIGIRIFQKVQRNGFFDSMTVVYTSPDLDNIEPTSDSQTKKRTPKELAELNHKNQHLCKGGTLRIFGDWHSEPNQNPLKLTSIDYDELKKQMVIDFSPDATIVIDEPGPVLESPSMLKILSAKRIKLEFRHNNSTSKKSYYKTYVVTKNKIKTETNIDWTKQKSDATIGQDALILFN